MPKVFILSRTNQRLYSRWRKAIAAPLLMAVLAFMALPLAANTKSQEPDPVLRALLMEAVEQSDTFEHPFDAEVWLTDMSTRLARFMPDAEERLNFLRAVHREAALAELSPELVLAVIQIESAFDRFALSYAGARGYMQVMPFWVKEIGRPEDNLFVMDTNLRYGCTILRHYLNVEKGNVSKALARYNGSVGKWWYPNRVLKAYRQRWQVN